MPNCLPPHVVLGFDFGLRNIGVAIGQRVTGTATPLLTLRAKQGVPNWLDITHLVKNWQPDGLVVGIPVDLDGTEQDITLAARQFAKELWQRYELPVYEAEERLTTKAARDRVFSTGGYKALQKESIDSIAAKLIVEEWLRAI